MAHARTPAIILTAALAMLFGTAAWAQSASRSATIDPSFANALLAETSTEELTQHLALSNEQHDAVSLILLDFTVAYYELLDEWRRRQDDEENRTRELEAARNENSLGAVAFITKVKEQQRSWAEFLQWRLASREKLRVLNLSATARIDELLSSAQQQSFQSLLRTKRRQRTLAADAHFAAEHVDLVNLFLERELLTAEEMDALRPALDRYAEDLDVILRDRNELLAKEEDLALMPRESSEFDRAAREGRMSAEEFAAGYLERERQERESKIERRGPLMLAHQRLRDLTLGYCGQCLTQLDEQTAAAVRFHFLESAYEMEGINVPRGPDRLIGEALALESLGAGQRAQIQSIRDDFWLPQRREVEATIMQARDRTQAEWESLIRGGEDSEALVEESRSAFQRRTTLEKETAGQVVEVLTAEQRELVAIPKYE